MSHEREKGYVDEGTATMVYSFVKHDSHTTWNSVLYSHEGQQLETFATNALVKEALSGRPLASFLILADGTLSPGALLEPGLSLAHLASYYLTA
jgi:hypothetical protein